MNYKKLDRAKEQFIEARKEYRGLLEEVSDLKELSIGQLRELYHRICSYNFDEGLEERPDWDLIREYKILEERIIEEVQTRC